MYVLGIDTSREIGAVALSDSNMFLAELSFPTDTGCLQHLVPAVDALISMSGMTLSDVDLIAVVVGPGSWSGLRIGVTTAKTFAQVLDKPIKGVSSLDVLAYGFRFTDLAVYAVMDARHGRVSWARYDCRGHEPIPKSAHHLGLLEHMLPIITPPAVIVGTLPPAYDDIVQPWTARGIALAPTFLNQPRPAHLAEAGLARFLQSGKDDALLLVPMYLMEAQAEIYALAGPPG